MLKIKDDVDLKELEKYGFNSFKNGYYKRWYASEYGICSYEINSDTRKIIFTICDNPAWNYFFKTEINDTLYDLIKADMVEKVEE